jgi:hypothetical protein
MSCVNYRYFHLHKFEGYSQNKCTVLYCSNKSDVGGRLRVQQTVTFFRDCTIEFTVLHGIMYDTRRSGVVLAGGPAEHRDPRAVTTPIVL